MGQDLQMDDRFDFNALCGLTLDTHYHLLSPNLISLLLESSTMLRNSPVRWISRSNLI